MRLIRKLLFVFVAVSTLLISQNFANAQAGHIDDEEIVIDGQTYKRTITEFKKVEPSNGNAYSNSGDTYNNDLNIIPFVDIPGYEDLYDYIKNGTLPSLDGQAITPGIVCDDPSGSNCYSMETSGTAIGELVYGEYFDRSDLWQKVEYDGKVHYVPVDELSNSTTAIDSTADKPPVITDTGGEIDRPTTFLESGLNTISFLNNLPTISVNMGIDSLTDLKRYADKNNWKERVYEKLYGNDEKTITFADGMAPYVDRAEEWISPKIKENKQVLTPLYPAYFVWKGFDFVATVTEGWVSHFTKPTVKNFYEKYNEINDYVENNENLSDTLKKNHFRQMGMAKSFVNTVTGFYSLTRNLDETLAGLYSVARHPVQFGQGMKEVVGNYYDNFCSEDSTDRECYTAQGGVLGEAVQFALGAGELKTFARGTKIEKHISNLGNKAKYTDDALKNSDEAIAAFKGLEGDMKRGYEILIEKKVVTDKELADYIFGWPEDKAERLLNRVNSFGSNMGEFDGREFKFLSQNGRFKKYTEAFEKDGRYNLITFDVDDQGRKLIVSNEGRMSVAKNDKGGISIDYKGYEDPMRGEYDYILKDGKIHIGDGHPELAKKGYTAEDVDLTVDYAGTIEITENGHVKYWSDWSGHFKPSPNDIKGQEAVRKQFKKQFDVDLPSFDKRLSNSEVLSLSTNKGGLLGAIEDMFKSKKGGYYGGGIGDDIAESFTRAGNPKEYEIALKEVNAGGFQVGNTRVIKESDFYDGVPRGAKIYETQFPKGGLAITAVDDGKRTLYVLDIKAVEDVNFKATYALLDQYYFQGGSNERLMRVVLDNVVEKNTLKTLNEVGDFSKYYNNPKLYNKEIKEAFKGTLFGSAMKRIEAITGKTVKWDDVEIKRVRISDGRFGNPKGEITNLNIEVPFSD